MNDIDRYVSSEGSAIVSFVSTYESGITNRDDLLTAMKYSRLEKWRQEEEEQWKMPVTVFVESLKRITDIVFEDNKVVITSRIILDNQEYMDVPVAIYMISTTIEFNEGLEVRKNVQYDVASDNILSEQEKIVRKVIDMQRTYLGNKYDYFTEMLR